MNSTAQDRDSSRTKRLSAALRENLKRRKAQERGRAAVQECAGEPQPPDDTAVRKE